MSVSAMVYGDLTHATEVAYPLGLFHPKESNIFANI